MKRKVISLFLSFLMILSLTPLVSAKVTYEEEQTENSIAAVYDGQGNLEGYLTSVDDIAEIDTVDFEVVLLKDLTVEIQGTKFSSYGLMASCNLNLNGHSVTVTGTVKQGIIITGVMVTGDISNGSILLNFTVNGKLSDSQAICGLFAADSSTISDVEIIYSGDSNDESIDGIAFGSYTSANPDTERKNTVKNVVVDVPGSAISEANLDTPASTMEIVSGSFKNLDTPSGSESITVPQSTTTIPGVNDSENEENGVTVYTSEDTTAVIVKDGNAYLYDTLQEAVDAAAKRSSTGDDGNQQEVTISLLKSPEEGDREITLPDELKDINVTINSLTSDEGTVPPTNYLDGVEIKTESGEQVTVDNDGDVTIVEVSNVSVSPTSLTLYSNTTSNTATLTATVTPADAATVTWSSDNASVATVNANGVVTAVGNGTATITATAGGKTATCTVTVTTYTPPVTPSDPTYPPEIADSVKGTVTTSPASPKEGDTVTITATPEEGYKVGAVTVTDEDGQAVAVTGRDGKYTFTQPEGKVEIAVTFVWDNPFSDVPMDAWYTGAIEYVEVNGLMDGLPGGLFAPNKELTRAEAVQILYNLEGQPTVTGTASFTDLTDDWYRNAIAWAEINGVVDGYGDGTFGPNDTVSREAFAQMMYNYSLFKKLDTSATGDLTKFPDGGNVSDWAETAMEWANGNGLINGNADTGLLDASGTAIRAHAASILMNFDLNLVKAE